MKYTVKVKETGTVYWYKEGTNILHCLHGPAVIGAQGTIVYYVDGCMHRLDGPARIDSYGKETYYINGIRYTKANFKKEIKRMEKKSEEIKDCEMKYTVEVRDGNTFWYKEGTKILHRIGGAAIEYSNGDLAYYEDNKLHCLNGYALQTINENNRAWYVRGVRYYTYPEYEKAVDRAIYPASAKPTNNTVNDNNNSIRYTVEIDNLGTARWYKEGTDILHRIGAPAIEYSGGGGVYYEDGKIHRIGGPALSTIHGDEHYYIRGKKYLNYTDYERAVEEPNKPTEDNSNEYIHDEPSVMEPGYKGKFNFPILIDSMIVSVGSRKFKLVEIK